MTLRAVFNVSKLCSCRFVSAAHCFMTTRPVYSPLLVGRQSFTLCAVSRAAATTDTDSSDGTKTRTVRRYRRNKSIRFKRPRKVLPVAEDRNDRSVSVLVDMIVARDREECDLREKALNIARSEVDEKLKELEEVASIEIRDIDLAVETADEENTEESATEKTEVCFSISQFHIQHVHAYETFVMSDLFGI